MPGPATDLDVPAYWRGLGLPGLADVHVHFLPPSVLAKVWGTSTPLRPTTAWPGQCTTGPARETGSTPCAGSACVRSPR